MATRIEVFSATITAGTSALAPATTKMAFNPGRVDQIDVKVPPGPAGNVGFVITCGGQQAIPAAAGQFIIPDNDFFVWALEGYSTAGSWGLTGYNTDAYDHFIQVFFHVTEVTVASSDYAQLPVVV